MLKNNRAAKLVHLSMLTNLRKALVVSALLFNEGKAFVL